MTTTAVFFIFRLFIFFLFFFFVLLLLSFYISFLFFLSPTIIYEDKRNKKSKKKYLKKKKYENLTGTPPFPLSLDAGEKKKKQKKNRTRIFIKRKTKDDGRVMKIWSTATAASYDEWRKRTWANSGERWAEQNNGGNVYGMNRKRRKFQKGRRRIFNGRSAQNTHL